MIKAIITITITEVLLLKLNQVCQSFAILTELVLQTLPGYPQVSSSELGCPLCIESISWMDGIDILSNTKVKRTTWGY